MESVAVGRQECCLTRNGYLEKKLNEKVVFEDRW